MVRTRQLKIQFILIHNYKRIIFVLSCAFGFKAVFRIRIHFFRIRIQRLRLEVNTDPDTDPDPIRVEIIEFI